jgi:hypothetical protein
VTGWRCCCCWGTETWAISPCCCARPAGAAAPGAPRPGRSRAAAVPGRPALLRGHEDWATWALLWPAGAGAAGIDRSSDAGKKDRARKDDDPEVFQILNRSIEVSIGGYISPCSEILGFRNFASAPYISGRREYYVHSKGGSLIGHQIRI